MKEPFYCYVVALVGSFFCWGLGLFSLLYKPKARVNWLFALLNFTNAFWNSGELLLMSPQPEKWRPLLFVSGMGGAFLFPVATHFILEVVGLTSIKKCWRLIQLFYLGAIVLSFLHMTPYLNLSALSRSVPYPSYQNPGLLYPLFVLFALTSLLSVIFVLLKYWTLLKPYSQRQAMYLILAVSLGSLGVGSFFLSFISFDFSWFYLPLQAAVSLVFALTIFKHNIVPLSLGLRRFLLVFGIYACLIMIVALFSSMVHIFIFKEFAISSRLVFIICLLSGILCSVGPFLYYWLKDRFSLFQEVFAGHLTHELKTPLAAIQSAELILADALATPKQDPKKIHDYLALLHRNTERLQELVASILKINQITLMEAHQRETFPIRPFVENILLEFPSLKERFTWHNNEIKNITASADGLKQIFMNLFSNIQKFSPEGPVQLSLIEINHFVHFSIQDQGIGITKESLPKIFNSFFKQDRPGQNKQGSGLGLAIVKKWVTAHGGEVWAESEGEGKGTTVTFTLPI